MAISHRFAVCRVRYAARVGPSGQADSSRGDLSRTRILDATASVLSRRGYAGTRLSDIAAAAEMQAPGIYYYFSSRDDLIEEVVRLGNARAQAHVEAALAALPADASAVDRICVAVEEHLRVVLERPDYTRAAVRNVAQLPDPMRKRLLGEHARYGELWHRLFVEARSRGELRSDVDILASQLLVIGGLNWAADWWSARRISIDAVIATASALARSALTAPAIGNRPTTPVASVTPRRPRR
jgi:AcrR family transcriptional regulator